MIHTYILTYVICNIYICNIYIYIKVPRYSEQWHPWKCSIVEVCSSCLEEKVLSWTEAQWNIKVVLFYNNCVTFSTQVVLLFSQLMFALLQLYSLYSMLFCSYNIPGDNMVTCWKHSLLFSKIGTASLGKMKSWIWQTWVLFLLAVHSPTVTMVHPFFSLGLTLLQP